MYMTIMGTPGAQTAAATRSSTRRHDADSADQVAHASRGAVHQISPGRATPQELDVLNLLHKVTEEDAERARKQHEAWALLEHSEERPPSGRGGRGGETGRWIGNRKARDESTDDQRTSQRRRPLNQSWIRNRSNDKLEASTKTQE